MDLISMARELGKAIQADTRYVAVQINRQVCDEDKALQENIEKLNIKRAEINDEVVKDNRDEDKIKILNEEFRSIYADILKNENMTRYNGAKGELDILVKRLTGIVSLCAEGQDAEACDYDPSACGGDCSGCSGCN